MRMYILSSSSVFLSTPSARRATNNPPNDRQGWKNFYPRPPRGGRPATAKSSATMPDFYPRPPRGGRLNHDESLSPLLSFLSTPSARRATA